MLSFSFDISFYNCLYSFEKNDSRFLFFHGVKLEKDWHMHKFLPLFFKKNIFLLPHMAGCSGTISAVRLF